MKWMEYIILYEDFESENLSEDLETRLDQLKEKKAKMGEKMNALNTRLTDSKQKAANFKEKAGKTSDPLSQKIYTNRASEEQMRQQILAAKAKVMQMQAKMTDSEISTTELKITRKERNTQMGK
jgi:chromosome segregation ATPase